MFTNPDNSDHNPHLESLFKKSSSFQLSDHQNPISNQHSPLIFSNFPSPFFDEHELPLNQIFTPVLMAPDQITQNNSGFAKKETSKRGVKAKSKEKADNVDQPAILRRRNLGVVPRKRSGKKDRHSKICTAQGIRDRRMRLSLQVARKFFDLQDLLGYDKASNTIEWLFSKSKKAIKDLMTKDIVNPPLQLLSDAKSESFISECEVVSGIEECSNNELSKQNTEKLAEKPNLRESREKARARARCRTREKMMIKLRELDNSSPNYHNDLPTKLGFFTNCPFEGVNQESDVGTIEKLLGNSRLSTSNCSIPDDNYNNYDQCCLSGGGVTCCIDPNSNFMGFPGNWDMFNNDKLINCSHYTVANQESLAAGNNSNSVNYSVNPPNFPLFHQ